MQYYEPWLWFIEDAAWWYCMHLSGHHCDWSVQQIKGWHCDWSIERPIKHLNSCWVMAIMNRNMVLQNTGHRICSFLGLSTSERERKEIRGYIKFDVMKANPMTNLTADPTLNFSISRFLCTGKFTNRHIKRFIRFIDCISTHFI